MEARERYAPLLHRLCSCCLGNVAGTQIQEGEIEQVLADNLGSVCADLIVVCVSEAVPRVAPIRFLRF